MYFQNLEENHKKPGRNSKNSKNLEEIQKTWRKFPKSFGHSDIVFFINCTILLAVPTECSFLLPFWNMHVSNIKAVGGRGLNTFL